MAKTVLVPIAEGTEELEAVSIIDTLRRAGAQVTVASVMDALQAKAARGVRLVADKLIVDCVGETYDAIVLPGGIPGAEHLRDSQALIDLLRQQRDAGRIYAAICASPGVVFQHHDLIGDKKATSYPGYSEDFRNKEAIAERVVVDGNCVTSQGPGTAIEFALTLIEIMFNADLARNVAEGMLASRA